MHYTIKLIYSAYPKQGCHLMKSKKRKTRLKILKKAEREIEKAEKKAEIYFYEILRFLKVLTISFSISNISLFF
jgi:hypothetical protein